MADVGHPNTTLTLKEYAALVRYFNGVLCAPSVKITYREAGMSGSCYLHQLDVSPRIDV